MPYGSYECRNVQAVYACTEPQQDAIFGGMFRKICL